MSLGLRAPCLSRTAMDKADPESIIFAVSLREFQGDEGAAAELFADEKEAVAAAKAQEERERAENVPGLLKPSEMAQDEEL